MQNRIQRKKANPYETIVEALDIALEGRFEDTDVSPEEVELAMHRLRNALEYIIRVKFEEFINEEVEVQSNPSSQHNA